MRSTPCMKSQDDEVIEGGSQVKTEALDEGHTSRSVSHASGVCHVQTGRVEGFPVWASKLGACLLVCGAQMWSLEAVVDGEGEGHAGPCRGTGSGEGRMLGLYRGTRRLGD